MNEVKIVRVVIDPHAPLSAEVKAELAALAADPDRPVDTSDIPPLDDAFWENAVLSPFYQPPPEGMPVRIDPDIAVWLRASGRGFERKLNAILREAMDRDTAAPKPKAAAKTAGAKAARKRSA